MNLGREYAIIANNEVYTTLRQNLKPKKIEKQNIRVISYHQDPTDVNYLSATVTWKPSDDMCYFYELIWHSLTDTMALPKVFEVHDVSYTYNFFLSLLKSSFISDKKRLLTHCKLIEDGGTLRYRYQDETSE